MRLVPQIESQRKLGSQMLILPRRHKFSRGQTPQSCNINSRTEKIHTADRYGRRQQTYETVLLSEDECVHPGVWDRSEKTIKRAMLSGPSAAADSAWSGCRNAAGVINNWTWDNDLKKRLFVIAVPFCCHSVAFREASRRDSAPTCQKTEKVKKQIVSLS